MAQAMVLGRLRRCEVLGLQLADLRVGQRRVFIANGKGGHQRLIPVSSQFFGSVAAYMETERPAETNTKAVFVAAANNQTGRQQLFQHLLDRLEQTPC